MSIKTIDIKDDKSSIAQLLSLVLEGNEVILAEDNKPLARLIPFFPPQKTRIPGLNRGEIWISDDFDNSLPESFWAGNE